VGKTAKLSDRELCRHRPAGSDLDSDLLSYRHSGDARYLPKHTQGSPYRYEPTFLVRIWQLFLGFIQFIRAGKLLGIEDHNIILYENKLAAIASDRGQSR
jgi:hypothetical protein